MAELAGAAAGLRLLAARAPGPERDALLAQAQRVEDVVRLASPIARTAPWRPQS